MAFSVDRNLYNQFKYSVLKCNILWSTYTCQLQYNNKNNDFSQKEKTITIMNYNYNYNDNNKNK